MEVRNYILATAGHIDHGKSALVHALSGIDPDRLPEEKRRGITIDLGFAHFDLPLNDAIARMGIIDVPGHEDFVKNMVAGIGSIDAALLVVAANEGWMPQTEEHLQILSYLGISRGVVALTKSDLVQSDSVEKGIREKLRGTSLASAAIISTSIVSGDGIENLKCSLAKILSVTRPQPDIGKPRLPVDRAFSLHGIGTVVTGTLTGGTLNRGQSVIVQPSGTAAKIRTIHSYNHLVDQASPGSRVALNLPDLEPQTSVKRGNVITLANLGTSHNTIDVMLEISCRSHASPLKHGTLLWAHHGSDNVPAVLHLQEGSVLAVGGRALAQLRLHRPILAFLGDRIVLRDWSQRRTLAGVTVLDPHVSRRPFRTTQRKQTLDALSAHLNDPKGLIQAIVSRDGITRRLQLLLQSRFSAEQVGDAIETLARDRRALLFKGLVADPQWWATAQSRVLEAIDRSHAAHPESAGLPLTELRQLLETMSQTHFMDALIESLCQSECVRNETHLRRANHRPALPQRLAAPAERILATLLSSGLNPPSRSQLAPDSASQQALRFLVQNGRAIEVAPDVIVHAHHYQKTLEKIRQLLADGRRATISQLKQALETSRRVMVPLAEKLDRDGVTSRQGDLRVLRDAQISSPKQ